MGAYTSWPIMAFTHHMVLRLCLTRLKRRVPPSDYREYKYYLLGDDVIIRGKELFDEYQLVTSQMGMVLNVDKTFSSDTFFEFAKRFFLNNEEVSPFPVGAIMSSRGEIAALAVGLDNALAKS
jgi:hypothetical protein